MLRQALNMFAIDTAFKFLEIDVCGIDLQTSALSRAILTAPTTLDKLSIKLHFNVRALVLD